MDFKPLIKQGHQIMLQTKQGLITISPCMFGTINNIAFTGDCVIEINEDNPILVNIKDIDNIIPKEFKIVNIKEMVEYSDFSLLLN